MTPGRCVIGVDIGGTRISAALVGPAGEVLGLSREATPRHAGGEAVLERLLAMVQGLIDGAPGVSPGAIGIGFGGPVDFDTQRVRYSHHVAGWETVDITGAFAERFGLPAYLENDANAGGLAEALFGAARGHREVLYVNLGTGVGGAVIIGGCVHRGAHGNAGEFGHIVLDPDGPECTCGKRGCVEALCSGDALGKAARGECLSGSALAAVAPDQLTGAAVGQAAAGGDAAAVAIVERAARSLGLALAGAANLMDPGIIVLGGGVPQIGDAFIQPCREAFRQHAMALPARLTPISPAALGYDAGVIGAAAVAMRESDTHYT